MNPERIKALIREVFPQGVVPAIRRLSFITTEWGHAAVNVPRELLRAAGAPDAPAGKRNWADEVARWSTVIVLVTLFLAPYVLLWRHW